MITETAANLPVSPIGFWLGITRKVTKEEPGYTTSVRSDASKFGFLLVREDSG